MKGDFSKLQNGGARSSADGFGLWDGVAEVVGVIVSFLLQVGLDLLL